MWRCLTCTAPIPSMCRCVNLAETTLDTALRLAVYAGPQEILRHGRKVAVIVSFDEWERMKGALV